MRYIDADALIKKIYPIGIGDGKYTINAKAVKLAIDNAPTADVVPKISLEMSQHLLMDALKRIEELDNLCGELQKAKTEVAMEFIEAVDSMLSFVGAMTGLKLTFFGRYAELKKKYIGGDL